jgi:hypothetical protein
MDNDQLQLLALGLEVMGLGLAYCHIFTPEFSSRLSGVIRYTIISLGARKMDYSFPGIDYDDEIEEEDKSAAAIGYVTFMTFIMVCWWWLGRKIEFGDGGGWGALEMIASFVAAALIAMPIHVLFSALVNALDIFLIGLGRGCYSASLGLVLALAGVCIEIYQVASTSFGVVLLVLPIAALGVMLRTMHNRL